MQSFFKVVFMLPLFVYLNRSREDMCEVIKTKKVSEQAIAFFLFWAFIGFSLKMSGVHFLAVAANALLSVVVTASLAMSVAIANGLLEYRKQHLEH